ncbi:tripartite motif-containing protein 66 isoform X2 [Stigmatopora nigra]
MLLSAQATPPLCRCTKMEKNCSECSETMHAQSLCTLCNKWLCYQCTNVHQHPRAAMSSQYTDVIDPRSSGSLSANGPGTGSHPCPLPMCHAHRQQPLELLCETCDLLCCSSCHLSSHKSHRVAQIGKALQDQRWLFESLMVQVEESRSAVENNAKQIEDRVHGVKIAHRKAENQIKMAKMIMMNELNKRANLLIEQLEKISEDFQQHLEDQLQGAIETCAQLDQVQKFISWATTHHCRGPVLFSKGLISQQIQQLLDSALRSETWNPVKIKFNWDASYWTKQMASLGQLTVEGGNCPFPPGLACTSVLRPQPITCLALPSVCHRESVCGYQMCYEPQVCCLHGLPSQSDLDKSQLGGQVYNASYVPAGPGPRVLSQQLPRCWDPSDTSALQTSSRCSLPPSHAPVVGASQNNCTRAPISQKQSSESRSLPESHPHQHLQRGSLPVSDNQQSAKQHPLHQCHIPREEALSDSFGDQDVNTQRCRLEEIHDKTVTAEHEEPQPDTNQESPVQQQQQQQQQFQVSATAEKQRKEQQRSSPPLMGDQINGRRSTSLEGSLAVNNCSSELQPSRINSNSESTTGRRCTQSIHLPLAATSSNSFSERPRGSTHSSDVGTAKTVITKYPSPDSRQRRASDGVLCIVKESSANVILTRTRRAPLLSNKVEPDMSTLHDEVRYGAKEKCSVSRNGHNSRSSERDCGRTRVPVVCLERLKVLISQLPPHGRRQSDPLPVSAMEKDRTLLQPRTLQNVTQKGHSGVPEMKKTPSVSLSRSPDKRQWLTVGSEWDTCPKARFPNLSQLPSDDPQDSNAALDFDSDSDPKSGSEEAVISRTQSQLDSDTSPHSSSEAELECSGMDNDVLKICNRNGSMDNSDGSLECDPDSASGAGSEDAQTELDADADSVAAETESDAQPEPDAVHQSETDSDHLSEQPLDSQGSAESEVDVESEQERTDEPQPLRSDLEEEYPIGPSQRPLLIANPGLSRRAEEVQKDNAETESEDFCAVCLIGGELLCCDRCPKVYHLSCHIPPLLNFPSGDWLCSLCRDVVRPEVEYDCENRRTSEDRTSVLGLSPSDQRKCERLTLLILNNILSAPFHEPVSPLARHYYQIIKRPIDLSVIRARLNKRSKQHYNSAEHFVADVYLMFHNCAKFNYPDSEVAQAGRSLEVFFTTKLEEVFPGRVFPPAEADSDSDEYDEAFRVSEGGFPWPGRREQCHRKRKRRQSLKSKKHYM